MRHRYVFPITIGDHINGELTVTTDEETTAAELEAYRQKTEKKMNDGFSEAVKREGKPLKLGQPKHKALKR